MQPCITSLMAYESGELNEQETLDLFQALVESGLAWQLQGHYGRTAQSLIRAGFITGNSGDKTAKSKKDNLHLLAYTSPDGQHRHQCRKCKTVWEHADDCHNNEQAHQCPNCRQVQWWKYHGDDAPAANNTERCAA